MPKNQENAKFISTISLIARWGSPLSISGRVGGQVGDGKALEIRAFLAFGARRATIARKHVLQRRDLHVGAVLIYQNYAQGCLGYYKAYRNTLTGKLLVARAKAMESLAYRQVRGLSQ